MSAVGNRNTPNSTPKLAERTVEVMHKYQEVGRDIEMLRDFLAKHDEVAGIQYRIVAIMLSVSALESALAQMQVAALNDRRL